MDLTRVLVVMMFGAMTHAFCTPESKDELKTTGSNITFRFTSFTSINATDKYSKLPKFLYFRHENVTIIDRIRDIYKDIGLYSVNPSYNKRVIIYGNVEGPFLDYWNITITLLNVSYTDAGQYQLKGEPDYIPAANNSFCLHVQDLPEIYISDTLNVDNRVFAQEGEDLVISGRPAKLLPSNSHYDIRSTWLLNGTLLVTGGIFTVLDYTLIIWPVSTTLSGANVTYRTMVVGHDALTYATTRLFVVSKSGPDMEMHPKQKLYVVNEGSVIPDIKCDVMYKLPTHVSWTRDEHVVSNKSVLSLGRVDRTMSGEYTCSLVVLSTGMIKEISMHIIVNEKPSAVVTIVQSTIIGLLTVAVIITWIIRFRGSILKRCKHSNNQENERPLEMNPYTSLQRESHDQQLYETADRSFTMEPPAILATEHRVYENQLAL